MGHTNEPPITDRAVAQFEETYGRDNVETQVYLGEVERFVDIVVDTRENGHVLEPDLYAVEVENDISGAISSTWQALLYADALSRQHGPTVSVDGVLVIPDGEGHVDQPDMELLEAHVRFVQLPPGLGG